MDILHALVQIRKESPNHGGLPSPHLSHLHLPEGSPSGQHLHLLTFGGFPDQPLLLQLLEGLIVVRLRECAQSAEDLETRCSGIAAGKAIFRLFDAGRFPLHPVTSPLRERTSLIPPDKGADPQCR